jgi:serine/threonine-protein kinase
MTPERLRRIRAVYEAAVDALAAGHHAVLERECAGDSDLRQEVDRLLSAREHIPEWLEQTHRAAGNAVLLDAPSTTTSHCAPAEGIVFSPGSVLGQRYRIVHLLGQGGMGTVYRADDLLLGQPVALKFLPAAATASPSELSRFRNEVRLARQVSHPNVCRVHDIGEAEGLTYLSMEYVDGEDLSSLLRRIGKLPPEKALEIARQLCAGLAAAHDKGVILRDLKPANIMLDGKGQVRITDFGIAGMAAQIRDVGSGTPAYMSPEQLAGTGVTALSDIYSLGVVLGELLTGKRPPIAPGEIDLDPAIERVIERCLEPDPHLRPASALSVSAALPGGHPLAAALARGETPAPELVANAGPVEGLRPSVAVACLALVIVGVGLLCVLRQKHDPINQIPMENSSEVLAAKAREITKSFGYTERPVDTLFAWYYDMNYPRYASERKDGQIRERIPARYPPAAYFWYRQSPQYPSTTELDTDPSFFHRETLEPGMQAVVLDSEGRLLEFHARPSAGPPGNVTTRAFGWPQLFAAADLDPANFRETPPELTPGAPFDAQTAWTEVSNNVSNGKLRVEAAAFRGRPVFFRVLGPWIRSGQSPALFRGTNALAVAVSSLLVLPAVCSFLAWRNARTGRSDRRGAFRLAVFTMLWVLLQALAPAHHTPAAAEFTLLYQALRSAVMIGVLLWVIYMAFEPQVRRRSPESLVSWSRLLGGRIRDPLVGGHLLIGFAMGVGAIVVAQALLTPPFQSASLFRNGPWLPWSGGAVLAIWFSHLTLAVFGGLGYMFVLNLAFLAVRRKWLALSIFILVSALVSAPYATGPLAAVGRSLLFFGLTAIALTRFGVLTLAAAMYAALTLLDFPLTTNWSAWYAPTALLAICTLLALALFGFMTTLAGRPALASGVDERWVR